MTDTAAVRESGGTGAIEVAGVSHRYRGGVRALDTVDLDIGRGLFGLLGPNGAGKSTLMKVICTLLVPSEGRVLVEGLDVVRDRRAIRRKLGYLPQEFGGWRLHRVEEVLDTLLRMSGVHARSRRRERVAAVLESVGLTDVSRRKIKKLSGGMVRRLGVAQALVHEPEILIVDEPTVGLDPEERIRFRELMASLAQQRTIILSTHIVADLGSACDDVALLDAGKIVFRGSPTQLVGKARGRVFDLLVAAGRADELEGNYEEVSRSVEQDKIRLRAVSSDGKVPSGAVPVTDVTLEEAYLAFMAGRDRAGSLPSGGAS